MVLEVLKYASWLNSDVSNSTGAPALAQGVHAGPVNWPEGRFLSKYEDFTITVGGVASGVRINGVVEADRGGYCSLISDSVHCLEHYAAIARNVRSCLGSALAPQAWSVLDPSVHLLTALGRRFDITVSELSASYVAFVGRTLEGYEITTPTGVLPAPKTDVLVRHPSNSLFAAATIESVSESQALCRLAGGDTLVWKPWEDVFEDDNASVRPYSSIDVSESRKFSAADVAAAVKRSWLLNRVAVGTRVFASAKEGGSMSLGCVFKVRVVQQ